MLLICETSDVREAIWWVLVDGFMCGDCVGGCELTAESVEFEDMLFYGMDILIFGSLVVVVGYVRVVMLVSGLECGLVCLFAGRKK